MTGQISTHFSWQEFEQSSTAKKLGIDNSIPSDPQIIQSIKDLVLNLLEPLRKAYNKPLIINSGYRTPELNKAVNGAKNSQHTKGQAADIHAPDPLILAQLIQKHKLPYDQLILYSTFIHLSYNAHHNRHQILYHESYKKEYPK